MARHRYSRETHFRKSSLIGEVYSKLRVDGSKSEFVDVVSPGGAFVERKSLSSCLSLGLLHQSVTIFLRNSREEIFLQQRSKRDDWLPGLWTASCTGHVKSGEDPLNTAKREMKEELGVECEPIFLFRFLAPTVKSQGRIERELATVYEVTSDSQLILDTVELEGGRFLTLEDCKMFFVSNKEKITTDSIVAFEKYLAFKEMS